MKLILLESVDGLGRPGDQVKVKNGFARNFLIPQRKAVVLTQDSMRMLGKLKQKAEAEERAMISSMEELAGKIGGLAVQVNARATDEGHLFGSVTEKDIHAAILAAGWEVPLRAVRLSAHIKEAGTSEEMLHLFGEITASISVEVVPVDVEGRRIEIGERDGDEDAAGEAPPEDRAGEPGDGDTPAAKDDRPAATAEA